MGWYDGNPSSLDVLPPADAAKKYLDYIGRNRLIELAKKDYDAGNYRWVAMVVKQAVFANPDDVEAKNLLADAYTQLGYQAESGPWRSIYLQGALELRRGVPDLAIPANNSTDVLNAMDPGLIFDYLAVRLDADKVKSKSLVIAFDFVDLEKKYTVVVKNSVLNYSTASRLQPQVTIQLSKTDFNAIQLKALTWKEAISQGRAKIEGNPQHLIEFAGLFENFDLWFNIVTP